MKTPKNQANATPDYLVEAAKRFLADAPEISAEQIAAAFKALGATSPVAVEEPQRRAA